MSRKRRSVFAKRGLAVSIINRREEIIRVAGSLFSRRGYHGTSMRDIAVELGLQAGSLYSHIRSKEELLVEVVEDAADQFDRAVRPIVDGPGTAAARLRRALEAHLRVMADNLETATVFFHEWRALGPELRERLVARRDRYQANWRRLIEAGIAAGEFRAVDPRFATLFVLSALNWSYQWYRPGGPLRPAEIAERYGDIILDGLRKGD